MGEILGLNSAQTEGELYIKVKRDMVVVLQWFWSQTWKIQLALDFLTWQIDVYFSWQWKERVL
jgi:hypothetical protein